MGGKQKELKKANAIAQASMQKQAQQTRKANRQAVRSAQQDRKLEKRQGAALIAAERESAALLAQVGDNAALRTDYIQDEEAARKKLLKMSGGGAYGFSRPMGTMLGGGMSQLG